MSLSPSFPLHCCFPHSSYAPSLYPPPCPQPPYFHLHRCCPHSPPPAPFPSLPPSLVVLLFLCRVGNVYVTSFMAKPWPSTTGYCETHPSAPHLIKLHLTPTLLNAMHLYLLYLASSHIQVLKLIMVKCGEWGFDTVWDGHYWMTDFETVSFEKGAVQCGAVRCSAVQCSSVH